MKDQIITDVMAMLPNDKDISEIMMRDKGSSCTNETKGAIWLKNYLKRQLLEQNPLCTLEEIKQKTAIIFNTKDIENIEDILSYRDLGKNIIEVLRAIQEL